MAGVAVLSVPTSERVLTSVFPGLEPYEESLELGRFVLDQDVPANAESWFLGRCWELAGREGVRGVVSFSDPLARTNAEGGVVFIGHVGTIYQATNAAYLGRATPRSIKVLPDGAVLSERAIQKIRAQEPGHEYVERQLVLAGARRRRPHEQPATWLAKALTEAGIRRLRHPGNHRYAFSIGPRRRLIRLGLASSVYPKKEAV